MAFESIFSKAGVALVVGAFALFVEGASVVQAQTRVTVGSPIAGSGAPHVATAERVVLQVYVFELGAIRSTNAPYRFWITQYKLSSKIQNQLSMSRSVPSRVQAKSTPAATLS